MLANLVALAVASAIALSASQAFPVIGATYQLDRAKYPGRVAVCTTEAAMSAYAEAEARRDQAAMKRMVMNVSTMADLNAMKKAEACTMVSSSSQAKIIEKGIEAHKAEFAAFALTPMWGHYLYFGGRVR
ncbi:MAG: hypothetical protein Q8L86_06350 [Vicinamibacterales bacterium]|nr:hypothetical protein [Vicinamibacterales bacterium]